MALDTGSFNPRSHEGSDRLSLSGGGWSGCFNPRSHEGSDLIAAFWTAGIVVSIHAPTKGATIPCIASMSSNCSFNPRSHEGSDDPLPYLYDKFQEFQSTLPRRERQLPRYNHTAGRLFQSTLPRRERHCKEETTVAKTSFNPRSHEGSDTAPAFPS